MDLVILFGVLLLLGGSRGGGGAVGTAGIPLPPAGGGAPPGGGGGLGLSPAVPRPPGDPPPGNCRTGWWDPNRWKTKVSVKEAFARMGYPVPANRDTMNALGPNQVLGGGDDVRSQVVADFQTAYNAASLSGRLPPGSGGLKADGFVGPCTLAAIQVIEGQMPLEEWRQ